MNTEQLARWRYVPGGALYGSTIAGSRMPGAHADRRVDRGVSERLTVVRPSAMLRQPWTGCPLRGASGPVGREPEPNARASGRGGEPGLAEVRVGENETFESALRRFNKKIQQSGILAEARRREHYEKPSVKRKRKEAKRKKAARTQAAERARARTPRVPDGPTAVQRVASPALPEVPDRFPFETDSRPM